MDRSFLLPGHGAGDRPPIVDAAATTVVTPLPVKAGTGGGILTTEEPSTGRTVIHLTTRDARGKLLPPLVLDWCRFGEIGIAFAEAIDAMEIKPASLVVKISDLDRFLAWLESQTTDGPPTRLASIGSDKLTRYMGYLDTAVDVDGKPYSIQTKRTRLGSLRTVFTALQDPSSKWRYKLAPNLQFPEGRWSATGRQANPHPVISEDAFRTILMAAASEVAKTMARHQQGVDYVVEGRRLLRGDMVRASDFNTLPVAVAAIEDWFGGYAKNAEQVSSENKALGTAIKYTHGYGEVFRFLYPGGRELVPFIVLLAVHTAYNPDTILGLQIGQIVANDVFPDQFRLATPERRTSRGKQDGQSNNSGRLVTSGAKGRARRGKPQVRSFRIDPHDPFCAHMLIENVKVLTGRIRPHAASKDRDRLFIFHVLKRSAGVRAFGSSDFETLSGDRLWQYFLQKFSEENGLVAFSLASIRATMADATEQLTGDIRAVQQLLGHVGSEVTFRHYLSAGARKRAAESVAVGQSMRHRWAETHGRRDTREGGQSDSLMAATPGMDCFDPLDSPMPGQVAGKMCSAWLACFFCPLALIRSDDSFSFARLVQLEAHVLAARATIAAERYQAVYVPILQKIVTWLHKFSPIAKQGALAISYLKPLPELE